MATIWEISQEQSNTGKMRRIHLCYSNETQIDEKSYLGECALPVPAFELTALEGRSTLYPNSNNFFKMFNHLSKLQMTESQFKSLLPTIPFSPTKPLWQTVGQKLCSYPKKNYSIQFCRWNSTSLCQQTWLSYIQFNRLLPCSHVLD